VGLLRTRQRPQGQSFHAPRQRVRQGRQQQHVGRAGEQEAARCAVPVDGGLDVQKQFGRALDLVHDDRPGKCRNEAGRVVFGRSQNDAVIQRQVAAPVPRGQCLHQRALAGLAGSIEQHHWRIGQGLGQKGFYMAWEHGDL